ncbi:MgtC/SapB family protein [Tepidanaerobacter sp. GT38]|uniref:MgtC/SapB family protein n=1 Tax=Tepidanaerobacter sp. GT38 TaxID=2722793 RepID=UPI001F265123|nr:MgtC/SapB family protein [Tepidanaerobacter sp. GT38]
MPLSYLELTIRLALSILLGGVIGLERETINKPAGFRTHILVCLGSTIVMLVSLFIFTEFKGLTNVDPGRIPAQVISGIGFLGAGTIIIEGANVKGLTTAASLWTVAAIGLAVGVGFYYGAILATFLILLTLITFNRLEAVLLKKQYLQPLKLIVEDQPGQLGKIGLCLGEMNISIRDVKIENIEEGKLLITLMIRKINSLEFEEMKQKFLQIDGIYDITTEAS